MKVSLFAPLAIVWFFFTACQQKAPQVSSSSPPSSTPVEVAEAPDKYAGSSPSLAAESPSAEASSSPSTNAASTSLPVFHSEAATKAASQYLSSYNALLSAVNNPPKAPTGNPEALMSNLQSTLQEIGRHTTELRNQKQEVDRQLTPEEKMRLRQYQKSLDQAGQE
jgi:hypothetical protein